MTDVIQAIEDHFLAINCAEALHVRDIRSGAEVVVRADEPVVAASVFKAIVALEFYICASAGQIDPRETVAIDALLATPGPTGVSNFHDPAQLSLRDLADLMMTVSDNAATDILIGRLGREQINQRARLCGCVATHIVSDLADMLNGVAGELGFDSYRTLLRAQTGQLGAEALAQSLDAGKIDACAALDPARATRTTARDMTCFLTTVWQEGTEVEACRALRGVMERQVARRLESAVSPGGVLAAKSGSLFGRIRNEVGVITYPDRSSYAFAIFTRARDPNVQPYVVHREMAWAVDAAIRSLRR